MNIKILLSIVFIIGLLIGYGVGFSYGATKALNWAVDKGLYFLELKGIEVGIDSDSIVSGLQRYEHKINACPYFNDSERG